METVYDALKYSLISVIVFGILGNILVIISIVRQKQLLKKNYYFLVLHLAICDLVALFLWLLDRIEIEWVDRPLYLDSTIYCTFSTLSYNIGFIGGVFVMVIISVFRYRATIHPFKTAIKKRKLIIACSFVYVVSLTYGCAVLIHKCYVHSWNTTFSKFTEGFALLFVYLTPTIFMSVAYYKIGRALRRAKENTKRLGSDAVRRKRQIRDRRLFLVCLSTVLCYAVGRLADSVRIIWLIAGENDLLYRYDGILGFAFVLDIVCTHSANPLIYGVLDKKLLKLFKVLKRKT